MNSQPSILVMVAVLETDDSVAEPAAEGRGPRLRGEQPMQKKKAAKISGFVAALCASGTLVGMAVSGTGAYFTDSHDGAINASTGHVKVNVSDTTLNFANLLPGEPKTVNVDYVANGTGNEDIWLVLPTNGGADALTDDGNGDGLGRYGHLRPVLRRTARDPAQQQPRCRPGRYRRCDLRLHQAAEGRTG
jgi:hypothetical protein